jgi:hypothetical protein
MGSKYELRLDGLPAFETSPFFCTLEPSTEAALRQLPNAYERAVAALRFRQCIGGDKDALGVSEDHVHIMQVAYLRAALMEYVAIEEVLPLDLVMRGFGEEPLRILDTGNAMLILLRELRHLQLHLVNTAFRSTSRSAVLRTKDKVEEFETKLTILTIPTADLRQLKTLRNATRFDPDELDAAISWFIHSQSQWGIGDVMQSGIQVYAAEVVQRYGLVST